MSTATSRWMNCRRIAGVLRGVLLVGLVSGTALAQGSLEPPGAPAATMKTLDQIEARIPISAVPFEISAPGSYYLTGNLTAAPGGSGITISANDVTLDLGGFVLDGTGGTGNGIYVPFNGTKFNVVVRNGTIRNWAASGVNAGFAHFCILEGLRVSGNAAEGLRAGNYGVVRDCTARSNGATGIAVTSLGSVTNCIASGNGASGIAVGSAGSVIDSVATDNSAVGISGGSGSIVQSCTARLNTTGGIVTGGASSVLNSTAINNSGPGATGITVAAGGIVSNSTAVSNSGYGIVGGQSSKIIGSAASFNTLGGISAASGAAISDCSATDNDGDGILVANDSQVVGNNVVRTTSPSSLVGIHATGSRNRIDSNSLSNFDTGIWVEAANAKNLIVRNSALGCATAYTIAAGNAAGATQANPAIAQAWDNFSE